MLKKADFSKKIIKMLSQKQAIPLDEITSPRQGLGENKYAVTRSLKGLKDAGFVEMVSGGQGFFARLTKEGKKKAHSQKLDGDGALVDTSWDGYWRMVILDIPEDRKSEREALRYLLKKAGFVCVKNSVWISMLPFENLFTNIKKDLNLTTEMMVIVTDRIDEDTEKEFLKLI
ncbi:MAG: repressor, phenylacetic acid degradation operon negative regulatory protein [Candidatus Parcubacteria bacterium]|jgi:DNA-binding transcriptional regulator PaaX